MSLTVVAMRAVPLWRMPSIPIKVRSGCAWPKTFGKRLR
jgi:hypothetical protein